MSGLRLVIALCLACSALGQEAGDRLQAYALENDLEQMKLAIKDGADPNWKGPGEQTPLMGAVLAGAIDAVKLMLTVPGVDRMATEKDGYTPMHGVGFQVG